MNRERRPAGFTLIEVMVALAIVAVTIGAGIRAAGALTNNTDRFAQVTQAQWCAENHLAEYKLLSPARLPDVGDTDFVCEQFGRSYRGKRVVRPTPNPLFRRMDAEIASETGEPLLTISTIVSALR